MAKYSRARPSTSSWGQSVADRCASRLLGIFSRKSKMNEWKPRRDWRKCHETWKTFIKRKSKRKCTNSKKINTTFVHLFRSARTKIDRRCPFVVVDQNARDVPTECPTGRTTVGREETRVRTASTSMGRECEQRTNRRFQCFSFVCFTPIESQSSHCFVLGSRARKVSSRSFILPSNTGFVCT